VAGRAGVGWILVGASRAVLTVLCSYEGVSADVNPSADSAGGQEHSGSGAEADAQTQGSSWLAYYIGRGRHCCTERRVGKGVHLRPFVVARAGRIALSFACSAAARQRRRGCDSGVTGLCCGRLLACPSQRSLSRRASPASRRHFTAAATMRCLRRESRPPQHTRTRTAERVCAHPYKRALTLASFRVEPSRSGDGWCVAALHCTAGFEVSREQRRASGAWQGLCEPEWVNVSVWTRQLTFRAN
jgi:hypothetical protein